MDIWNVYSIIDTFEQIQKRFPEIYKLLCYSEASMGSCIIRYGMEKRTPYSQLYFTRWLSLLNVFYLLLYVVYATSSLLQ